MKLEKKKNNICDNGAKKCIPYFLGCSDYDFYLFFCGGSRQTGYLLSPLETRHQVSRQIGAVVV